MPHQLTIRFDDAVAREIDELARREGISKNRAAVRLLQRGAGIEDEPQGRDSIGDSLDWFIGSWSKDRAMEIDEAVADFEMVDEDLWR